MGKHARHRARSSPGRRSSAPVAALGVGLAQLAAVVGGAGAGSAVAAPEPSTPTAGETPSSTPCEVTAKACVRLSTNQVWITDGEGTTMRGPFGMNKGAKKYPTPTGTFHVQRKERYHESKEYEGRQMPYSVFFDGEGRALHQGDPERESAGCVRLERDDAAYVFEHLDISDEIQIVK